MDKEKTGALVGILRKRILAGLLCVAAVVGLAGLAVKNAGESRILFPPEVGCEVLQKDANVEVSLQVDRRNTGVYDYVCAYEMDRYGRVYLTDRSLWQSYSDAVPKEAYKALQEICPGEVTRIMKIDTGYLVVSWQDPFIETVTETNESFEPIFQYTMKDGKGISTAFVQEHMLYVVSYDGGEQRTYLTSVDKATGEEKTDSFTYGDFVPDADEEASLGKILFHGANMWVKNGILYFAETYFDLEHSSVLGAYDLENDRAVSFEVLKNSQIVMVRKEPEQNRVAVVVNPMYYQPLELYTVDDETMEVISIVSLDLPAEYLTRKDSEYAVQGYYFFHGDMDEEQVAVLFGDIVSRESLEDETDSRILVVYSRETGKPVWRGRFQMDIEYEVSRIELGNTQ